MKNVVNYLLAGSGPIYRFSHYFCYQNRFFLRVDNYNLGRKLYTSQFFSLFCEEIIRVICTILVVIIKDLKLYCKN